MARAQIVDTIIEIDGKVLMLRRNFKPKNKLDLLGGFVDENEGIEEAAIREVNEESGFDVELIQKLGVFDYFDRGEKTDHVFIGKIIGGKLKSSVEGELVWIDPTTITAQDLAFPQLHVQVLNEYLKFKGSGATLRR